MKTTETILDDIVATKRAYLEEQKRGKSQAQIEAELADLQPSQSTGFFEALKASQPRPKILAEAKKASPSGGVLREPFDLAEINNAYQAAKNVVAISVITEEPYFRGSDAVLSFFAANNANNKPLLRKDFVFDPYQVVESKLLGARAYLLIASLLDKQELGELVDLGVSHGLEPLVEVHDQQELDMALETNTRCIGANCRDLKTFSTDPSVHNLLKQLDGSYARVAESAIGSPQYLGQLATFSDAALIGTHFMRSADIPAAIEAIAIPLAADS
jgi:indole-3-glycerol phosphate synthase